MGMSETAQEKLGPNAPDNSDFKQQRLKAWQPILTPYWVIFTFLTVGVVFLSIGVAVLVASNNVVEVTSSKYQDLVSTKAGHLCKNPVNSTANSCLITQTIKIPKDMKAPVYVYYELDNFYQNHRRYVKSRADTQLRGDDKFFVTGCEPRDKGPCTSKAGKKGECAVYPCGLIAWSVFNDTFYLNDKNLSTTSFYKCAKGWDAETKDTTKCTVTPWKNKGIAWSSDKEKKFIQMSAADAKKAVLGRSGTFTPTASNTIMMPYKSFKYYKCADESVKDLSKCADVDKYADVNNEEFIVWMRTSGLPNFRKLHRIIDTDLKEGEYVHFTINNVFPVSDFSGTKAIVLSTTEWIGGKNKFLGWAYIVVAIVCILLAIGFFVKQLHSPRAVANAKELEEQAHAGGQ